MVVFHAIEGVLSLLLIGLVGYLAARRGWFNQESKAALPNLITNVALPLYLIASLTGTFRQDELAHLLHGALVPMLSMLICWGFSLVVGKIAKIDQRRIGLFHASFTTSNSIFIGVPVNIALFGETSLPYVLLYFFANTLFFWTVGNYYISADSDAKTSICSFGTLKKVCSMPMIGFGAALLMISLDVKLPDFLMTAAKYLGGMTTPLAIIFIGIVLYEIDLKRVRLSRDLVWIMVGRFVVSPLSVAAVIWFIPVPELMRKVFIIQASLPVMVQTVVLSGFYRTDTQYATLAVSVTTIASVAAIPIMMLLVS